MIDGGGASPPLEGGRAGGEAGSPPAPPVRPRHPPGGACAPSPEASSSAPASPASLGRGFERLTCDDAREELPLAALQEVRRRILVDVVRTAVPPAPLVRTCGESSPPHLIPWIDPAVADGVAQAEHFNDFQLHQTARLAHMLLLYASFDPECNYCQGMSDLALPFVLLFPEDWLAFWCFERLMRQARHNFREDELGVKLQLDAIRDTLAVVDPQIFGHIEGLGVREYHFAFRMVLVMLRRELSLESALRVWEQVWAIDGLNEHFVSVEVSSGDSVVMDPGMLTFVVAAIISRCGGAVRGCAGQEDLLQLFTSCEVGADVVPLAQKMRKAWSTHYQTADAVRAAPPGPGAP